MNNKVILASSALWATAIIASALLRAPWLLTGILLPALATSSLLLTGNLRRARLCENK